MRESWAKAPFSRSAHFWCWRQGVTGWQNTSTWRLQRPHPTTTTQDESWTYSCWPPRISLEFCKDNAAWRVVSITCLLWHCCSFLRSLGFQTLSISHLTFYTSVLECKGWACTRLSESEKKVFAMPVELVLRGKTWGPLILTGWETHVAPKSGDVNIFLKRR